MLRLGEQLSLSTDVATMSVLILGKKGSGKTNTIVVMAEELYRVHIPVCIWDPTGKHYGIKSRADGKDPGLPFYIFGGVHQDLPLYPESGAQIADVFLDKGISMVLDVQAFSGTEKARFITAFANQMFKRGPENEQRGSARHVLMEEADQFFPQNPYKGEEPMLGAVSKLYRLGRNYWYGFTILSQRSAKIHKDGTTQADILLALRTTGPQDQKVVEDWLKYHHLEDQKRQAMEQLASLPTGTAIVWWPEEGIFKTAGIRHRSTLDTTSSRPTVKRTIPKNPVLAAVDLEQLRKDMAQAIERRKQEDPVELRKAIAELQRQLKAKGDVSKAVTTKVERLEIPVMKDAAVHRLEQIARAFERQGKELTRWGDVLGTVSGEILQALGKAERATGGRRRVEVVASPAPRPFRPVSLPRSDRPAPPVDGEFRASASQQRILNGLAWLESVGIPDADKTQVALLADQSPTSGGYFNNLGALRTAGCIDYPVAKRVALTDAGRQRAAAVDVPQTSEELQEQLYRRLSSSQAAILRHLVEIYDTGRDIEKSKLAERVGQSPTSGGYFNNLGRLRSLGLIDYPAKGRVRAQPVLFLEKVA